MFVGERSTLFIFIFVLYFSIGFFTSIRTQLSQDHQESAKKEETRITYLGSIQKKLNWHVSLDPDTPVWGYSIHSGRLHGIYGIEAVLMSVDTSLFTWFISMPLFFEIHNFLTGRAGQWQLFRIRSGLNSYFEFSRFLPNNDDLYRILGKIGINHERHLIADKKLYIRNFVKEEFDPASEELSSYFEAITLAFLFQSNYKRLLFSTTPGFKYYAGIFANDPYKYRRYSFFIEIVAGIRLFEKITILLGYYHESILSDFSRIDAILRVEHLTDKLEYHIWELGLQLKNFYFITSKLYITYEISDGRGIDFLQRYRGIGFGWKAQI